MTSPTAPPPLDRPPASRRSDRFFAWVAGLGIARSDGWIGGVAAGLAARLRIDPLIVRGVLVVATLCGLPLVLVYALAWALLPDAEGRIHLRELIRGRFEPAQLGILAGVAFGLFASGPSLFSLLFGRMVTSYGEPFYAPRLSPFGTLLFIVGLVLIGILLVLIVRAARRTPGDVTAPAP
ncbi:PspC domain-containing protein, partial [Microbacterium esteraromaticum]